MSLAQTLKATAAAKQAELAADQLEVSEPGTDIMNALTAAAEAGELGRTFPKETDDPPLTLTLQERNWLTTVGGFTVTTNAEVHTVSFSKPRAVAEES